MPPCASVCHVPDAESWRSENLHAPAPPPRRTPTRPWESASAHGANSATARSVGKSSACQSELRALSWSSSSILRPLPGLPPTLPITPRHLHSHLPQPPPPPCP